MVERSCLGFGLILTAAGGEVLGSVLISFFTSGTGASAVGGRLARDSFDLLACNLERDAAEDEEDSESGCGSDTA